MIRVGYMHRSDLLHVQIELNCVRSLSLSLSLSLYLSLSLSLYLYLYLYLSLYLSLPDRVASRMDRSRNT